jgi:hypothetical protein
MNQCNRFRFIVGLCLVCLPLAALADRVRPYTPAAGAVCRLMPANETEASGYIRLFQKEGKVDFSGDIQSLKPGSYVLTLHMYGDLQGLDARHVGPAVSVGNPEVDVEFKFKVTAETEELGSEIQFTIPELDVKEIIGRSIVVRTGDEDAVAWGVIGIPSPPPLATKR